ncbi:PREDICTED: phospholipase DDHD1-like isoform X2 [Priapulus caudatus]|nr:PREDICTED: phospholipase DDHD1-like isoform X2 [Priapulus caudatus]XP_014673979.1 PREDICTED: phospholipase DDHD1-like isoform X2 [Priapulus caudatus]
MQMQFQMNVDDEELLVGSSYEHESVLKGSNGRADGDLFRRSNARKSELAADADMNPGQNNLSWSPEDEAVEEMHPEEARWFYRERGDKDRHWTAFIGYDSLRIECKYRELQLGDGGVISEHNVETISARGDLFEVDVVSKKCFPIYWAAEAVDIMRGTWFLDGTWQPLDATYADLVEAEHMRRFYQQTVQADRTTHCKGKKPVIHHLQLTEFHIDWNSPFEVFMFSDNRSSKLMRSVTSSLGFSKYGVRLHRGFCEEARPDDKLPEITHLMFVVHGIGQKMDTNRIIKSCKTFRQSINKQMNENFGHILRNHQRAECLPVEWRSSLKLDDGVVESVTLHKVRGLRELMNSTVMDVMYYDSPLYRSELVHGLQRELNRLYDMFCLRHPYFEASGGKVSIVAHSLGAVITYDIITGWNPVCLYDQYVNETLDECIIDLAEEKRGLYYELERARKRVKELEAILVSDSGPTLKFKLDNLFLLGSPLPVFLALRGMQPRDGNTLKDILPSSICKRIFNIYHPFDPVAYRMEPLLLKHYESIHPVTIHKADVTSRTPYEDLKTELIQSTKISERDKVYATTSPSGESTSGGNAPVGLSRKYQQASYASTFADLVWSKWGGSHKATKFNEELKALHKMVSSDDDTRSSTSAKYHNIDPTDLEYRIDYVLREGSLESQYISAITSHASYWASPDVSLFILTHLFPEDTQTEPKYMSKDSNGAAAHA